MTLLRTALAFGTLLVAILPVRAGLYNTAEPALPIEPDLTKFVSTQLAQMRSFWPPDALTGNQPSDGRTSYLQKVQQLQAKQAAGPLSAEETANLGAYLIRLRRTRNGATDLDEALRVLEAGRREHPRSFQVLANLGTAYQIAGRLDAAESCLLETEALAPKEHRTLERYHLQLVRQRLREQLTPGLAPLDQLFVGPERVPVRYVSESGEWRPGELAAAELKKLPGSSLKEATGIVQQFLLWFPDDARLHWQLGELANAGRDYKAAARAMEAAVYDFRLSTPDLRRHRALLQDPAMWQVYFERVNGGDIEQVEKRQRAWLTQALAAGFQGAAVPDVGQQAVWQWRLVPRPPDPTQAEPPVPAGSSALTALGNLDWRGWLIIAAGGLLVASLAVLQLRNFARRRARHS
jgi:tetratricopeptide (TPR) repeat protein